MLVQGLGRVRILRATQAEPFARVDAEGIVDAETVAAWEALAREVLAGEATAVAEDSADEATAADASATADATAADAIGDGGGAASGGPDAISVVRLAAAGAVAAEEAWRTYDAAEGFDGDGSSLPPTLVPWNTT